MDGPVPRGGAEVAREAEKAQEVPTPVDSRRIAPKFDEFPD